MERRVAPKLDFSLLSNVTKSSRRKLFLWVLPDGSAPIIPTADLPTHLQVLSAQYLSVMPCQGCFCTDEAQERAHLAPVQFRSGRTRV